MKFQAKLVGLLNGLQPVLGVAQTGTKREYPDAYKVTLSVKKDTIVGEAHNGNVAITNTFTSQNNLDYVYTSDGTVTVNAKDLFNTFVSFDKNETVDIELNGNELVVIPQSDTEKVQTVPCESRAIEMPKLSTTYDKTITLNKPALVQATEKVLFAIGFEKFRAEFLYWKLMVGPKSMRAVCGDGGRFPLYEIEGDNIVDAKDNTTFLIYKEHNASLLHVLSTVEGDTVTIKEHRKTGDAADTPSDQFVISLGTANVILIGHDPGVSWPDESQFLARKNVYKFVSKSTDWDKEMAGVWATYNEDVRNQNATHVTTIVFDSKKKVITLKSDNTMKSLRKVKMLDFKIDSGQEDVVEFKCLTTVLRDAIKQADGCNLQMELLNSVKPMVLKYFAADTVTDGVLHRVNQAAGTKEQYVIAFGAFNKNKK